MNVRKLPEPIHPSDLGPQDYRRIAETLRHIGGVQKVTLFGSRALGSHRYNSDVDILLEGEQLGYHARAEAFRSTRALGYAHEIDIVIDRWISEPALWSNIQREGIVLWCEHSMLDS